MSEFTMDWLRENLEALKMKNTLEILDNYLERAVAENLNIVEILDHIFSEEAKSIWPPLWALWPPGTGSPLTTSTATS